MQGCGLRDRARDLTAKNAAILGISFDTVQENRAFAEKFKFPYPLLCDTSRTVGTQYGAADPGETKNARRIAYIIGPEGKVRNVFPKANTATFAADVLALL
ncbi:MAG: redoxin domain-containing protein [Deltaproteobacteria bacterium]|nr:MAG: redoxin domain-containing protein [Deltaproteobacteria bacterium]